MAAKSKRGFAAMDPEKQREIASMGGRAAHEKGTVEWVYCSERSAKDGAIFIPRGVWHGYYNFTNDVAVVLYWLTSKYNPADEERMSVEAMGFDWMRRAR